MNRRTFFKSIVASGLMFATTSVLTGCSVTNNLLSTQETVDKKANRIATIEFIQIQYKKGLYVMEELNFRTRTEDSYSFDTNFTLPWYVGSKINVVQNDYLLATYSATPLLESGYGIGNKIEPMYRTNSAATPAKLNALGFRTTKELYSFVFDRLTSYSSSEVYSFLKAYDSEGVISLSNILDLEYLQEENDKFVANEFRKYTEFEKAYEATQTDKKKVESELPLDKWYFYSANNKQVHFLKEDYLIYTMTKLIVDGLLEKSSKGFKANV